MNMSFISEGYADDVFGLLMYEYGWSKLQKIHIFDRDWDVLLYVKAQPGQDPNDAQIKSYKIFSENQKEIMAKVENNLKSLLSRHPRKKAVDQLRPNDIHIEKNGKMTLGLEYAYMDFVEDGEISETLVSAEECAAD